MADKIYCGSGRKQTSKKGIWLKCTVNPDVLKKYIQEYQGNKFVKIDINVYDEPNQFGKDVTITIDEYKPAEHPVDKIIPPIKENNDLPF